MMVATAIGLFLVAAVLTFVSHQGSLLEYTKTELERDRGGRLAMDMLAQDLRHAGVGVGYSTLGSYSGFLRADSFTVGGGAATWTSRDRAISHDYGLNAQGLSGQYTTTTDDVGLRIANGDFRTIVAWNGAGGSICAGGAFDVGDLVLLAADDSATSVAARITGLTPNAGCPSETQCNAGCDSFNATIDGTNWESDAGAETASYLLGEVRGGLRTIVWYVEPNTAGGADLRRAEPSTASPCADRATCGDIVAYDAETLQVQIWEWDTDVAPPAWVEITDQTDINNRYQMRVDVELVVRTRTSESGPKDPVALRLTDVCLPGGAASPCTETDQIARRALRTSIQVRNSGRMQFQFVTR